MQVDDPLLPPFPDGLIEGLRRAFRLCVRRRLEEGRSLGEFVHL